MKLILGIGWLLFASAAAAGTRYWDGEAGDGLWENPSNWTDNLLPAAGDDVILDNSIVAGNYTVSLPSGAVTVTVNSILIAPSSGVVIILLLPSANTANPGLQVTGSGDALWLQAGAVLKNSSGASAGSGISISNRLRINDGAKYIHNTRRSNATIVSQLSTASGTAFGEFEFDVPPSGSYTPSLSGRTFGTLSFSAMAGGGNSTYAGSGASDLTVRGHLNIHAGATLALSMTSDINVAGNLALSAGATFNLQTSSGNDTLRVAGNLVLGGLLTESGSGFPVLELSGSSQTVSGAGQISGSINFRMNSSGTASLGSPLAIPFALTLSTGRILSSTTNILTLSDNAVVNGGGSSSFVQGPMRKAGDEDFIFPLGSGNIYAPLSLLNGSGQSVTDSFTAEYRRANPQNIYGSSYGSGIHHISFVEYWLLNRSAGAASKRVALAVHEQSFCLRPATSFLARFNGAQWTAESSTASGFVPCGAYQCGTLNSNNQLTEWGPFTIATSDSASVNPLPIRLLSFRAVPVADSLLFVWEMGESCPPGTSFELQRSADGIRFGNAIIVPGNETGLRYRAVLPRSPESRFFRLKIRHRENIQYSPVLAVRPWFELGPIFPNPVRGIARIPVFLLQMTKVIISVYDVMGTCVYRREVFPPAGGVQLQLDLSGLRSGLYQLRAATRHGERMLRFVKD